MKARPFPTVFICILSIIIAGTAAAQEKKESKSSAEQAALAAGIQNRQFSFKPQQATPMSGRTIQLNYGYELRIKQDSLVVYLPYYGRAYTAPIDPTKGALDFASTQFQYTVTERKKGGWNIVISPTDGKDVRQMSLSISTNGYTSLQVMSTNRQPISFYGQVSASVKTN